MYLREARGFLDRQPYSRFAPRVALDVLMVAERMSDRATVDAMKARLLFGYPQSLQASHVVSLFPDAKQFREFVMAQGSTRLKEAPGPLPEQFTRVVILGLRRFKDKLLANPLFLVQAHCFAAAAGAAQVVDAVTPALRKECSGSPELSEAVQVYSDSKRARVEKVTQLNGLDSKEARFLEYFYLSRLSAEERTSPKVVKIRVENAISDRDYATALALLESASDQFDGDPQILFWRAWTLFAQQRDAEALAVAEQITTQHADSDWAPAARAYAEGIRNFGGYGRVNIDAILGVSRVFKAGVGVFELSVEYVTDSETKGPTTFTAYVGVVPDENRLEVCLHRDAALFLAYRTDAQSSAIFLEGEPEILMFTKPGPVPAPSLSLSRAADGKFSFNGNLAMGSSVKEAGATSSTLFDSPFLSTSEGIATLLAHGARRRGSVPCKPVDRDGGVAFSWLLPATDSATSQSLEFHISAEHRITRVSYGGFRIKSLNYGPRDSHELTPPAWPELPVRERGEFDISAMMKLIGAVGGLLGEAR